MEYHLSVFFEKISTPRAGQIEEVEAIFIQGDRDGDILAASGEGCGGDDANIVSLAGKAFDDAFGFGGEDIAGASGTDIHRVAAAAEALTFIAGAAFAPGADFLAVAIVAGEAMPGVFRHEKIGANGIDIHLAATASDTRENLLGGFEFVVGAPDGVTVALDVSRGEENILGRERDRVDGADA